MLTIETLEKRIQNKENELIKLEKKLERILKAEKSNYKDNNPYYYTECDKKYCLRDIEFVKDDINRYKEQLQINIEKANSRDVKIIVDFLNNWKERVYHYYEEDLSEYYDEKSKVKRLYDKFLKLSYAEKYELGENSEYYKARHNLHCKLYGYKERQSFTNYWGKEDYRDIKVRDGEWEHLKHYVERCNSLEECLKLLDKELEQEKNRKYDFIIERVNKIVGQITDATGLRIGAKSDLNGIIIGSRGKAHVETIGAGGHNDGVIVNVKHGQIFHFRTLIKEIK